MTVLGSFELFRECPSFVSLFGEESTQVNPEILICTYALDAKVQATVNVDGLKFIRKPGLVGIHRSDLDHDSVNHETIPHIESFQVDALLSVFYGITEFLILIGNLSVLRFDCSTILFHPCVLIIFISHVTLGHTG